MTLLHCRHTGKSSSSAHRSSSPLFSSFWLSDRVVGAPILVTVDWSRAKIDKYILPLPTNAAIVDIQSDDEVPEPKEATRVKRRSSDYLKQFRSISSDDAVAASVLFIAHELGKKPTCGLRVRAKKLARRISSSGYHLGVKKLGKKSRISSSHAVRLEKAAKPVIVCRGPKMLGFADFDEHCVFGNNVKMAPDQVSFLRAQVAGHLPPISYYVCKMTMSNVITGKAKMYFSAKYSNSYLNQHLDNGFLDLHVLCPAYDGAVHLRLIHGYKDVAQMTSHWTEVLEKARIKARDLCIFTFMNDVLHGLMVHVSCLN
ncbi:hypothetical protein ACQ4PT_043778 [Festuca glaucescens]